MSASYYSSKITQRSQAGTAASMRALEIEAGRLGMRTSMDDLIAAYGRCIKLRKIYNIGFLAMTR
jgi:hypothetical protein